MLERFDAIQNYKKMDLNSSIKYWRNQLSLKVISMFDWNGIPFPQKEIEVPLLLHGYVGICKAKTITGVEKIVACRNMSMSGVTEYPDEFKYFTLSAPTLVPKIYKIGNDCAIIDTNQLRFPLIHLVDRYALMLAHAEITLLCETVNERYSEIFRAQDRQQEKNILKWREKVENGDYCSVMDSEDSLLLDNPISFKPVSSSHMNDFVDVRNNIYKAFLTEIGVKFANDKKERLIVNEVESDTQSLLLNVHDMLECRKRACDDLNSIFGLNVTVELSKPFEILEQGSASNFSFNEKKSEVLENDDNGTLEQ